MDLTKYRAKLIGNEEERAVSPVIGVILMVAITVILAAVIAAFVLDMGSGLDDEPRASVDIEGDGTPTVEVQLTNMDNSDGVAVVDSSGAVQDTFVATGGSATYDGSTLATDADYTVQAFQGDESDVSGASNIEDAAASNAIVGEFTLTS
ncbi:type IV pilin [Natrialba asiatica]|uniref:Archaeal Type IV pilin N-terminal domain-containing protein n=1 Tax=Natrialba asiatica (strain ATCC 700177 / DSM 12278 / JCM 9576 / FERM P-10747 / NBRC 102637 / 172P1) TaxID=29540 RepID=M0AHR6_NATA1|nr:type IV pilin N-terminal domain-containing protein [Natrialba asiatica]ELY97916.1 hypothetical protein C481_18310 [Natrialba asiatica DSM 12278]